MGGLGRRVSWEEGMSWHSPLFFILILVLVALVVLGFVFGHSAKAGFLLSSFQNIKGGLRSLRVRLFFLPHFLKILSMLFVIISLARPQTIGGQKKQWVEGIDIIIVLDISASMLAEDIHPNRLEASKKIIKKFIQKRSFDRIGLLIFSGEPQTLVPGSWDYNLLLQALDKVKPVEYLEEGTAIGTALASAVDRFKNLQTKTKIVVFLTDGDNNRGIIAPETAIDIAKRFGVKVYSIGVGSQSRSRIPITYKTLQGQSIKTHQWIDSRVNKKMLTKMAKLTGGEFFLAKNALHLENIFKKIDDLEKTKIKTQKNIEYDEKFRLFLSLALFIYLLSFLLEWSVLRVWP